MRILVLDGEHRSALAAVRSLGRKGHDVFVGSELKKNVSGVSKYCKGNFIYSAPGTNSSEFINNLKDHLRSGKIDALLPMTDTTMYRVLQYETEFRKMVLLPAVSFELYRRVSDKCNLMKLAERLDVAYPGTEFFLKAEDALKKRSLFRYPLVLKPQYSIIEMNGKLIHCRVSIIDTEQKLHKILAGRIYQKPFMVQNYITGEGLGIFTLCSKGDLKAYCSHRRIREKPPWGGVSVVSESVIPDQSFVKKAHALLNELNWQGVAMVEFKNDLSDNVPKLMEINARFWGSLQLSIDAGIDFPNLLLDLFNHQPLKINNQIRHTRFRWLMGDLDNLIINFRYGDIRTKAKAVQSFITEFFTGSKIEDFRYNDFKPFLCSLLNWIKC